MEKQPEFFLEIKWIDAKKREDLEDAYQVRREVFINEQKVPEKEEIDDVDLKAHHVLVYEHNRPIATGRLSSDGNTWLIGRIAVLKEYRGKHTGKLVVEKLLEKAADLGAEKVHVHAQTHASGFYESLGFVVCGGTFMESGIEHIGMVKNF